MGTPRRRTAPRAGPEPPARRFAGPAAVRRARARAQLLGPRAARAPAEVVAHLLAVQAQDLRAARLALRARGVGAAGEVEAALTRERSIVRSWLNRGTLHLVASEDLRWLLALTAPAWAAASRARLSDLGVGREAAERAVAVVDRALADEGPLTRPALAARLAAAGLPTAGQAAIHLLRLAAGRGVTVLGPVTAEGEQAFARTADWLGAPAGPAPDRPAALAELARRYGRGHGPAEAADLAHWSGLSLGDARSGFAAAGAPAARGGPAARLGARLLGAYDPYLLGWRDRSFAVAASDAASVHPGGGVLRAVAVDDGAVVGTWRRQAGRVVLEPFGRLSGRQEAALSREAAAVARFEDSGLTAR